MAMLENRRVSELTQIIRETIAAGGVISFAQFMELALYQPGLGYYETDQDRVGFQGDFYTSVSIGELFGQLLAFRLADWLARLSPNTNDLRLVEAGAHDGRLAKDILSWLRQHRPELFSQIQYWIVEPSARRRKWQQETLREFGSTVQWVETLAALVRRPAVPLPAAPASPETALDGIIFSNELLDALPVRRWGWDATKQAWFEWGVAVDGETFTWAKMPPDANPAGPAVSLPDALLQVLPDGYTLETCPAAADWWRTAANVLGRGWLMTLDYGFTLEEMINPSRTQGTLRAYHRHQLSDDLLTHPGAQDLTAHVNFSLIQAAGESAGLHTEGYLTQPKFLTGILGDAIKDAAFREWTPRQTRQFQTLTHPQHLGRSFKVLVQRR